MFVLKFQPNRKPLLNLVVIFGKHLKLELVNIMDSPINFGSNWPFIFRDDFDFFFFGGGGGERVKIREGLKR
jgi:hypothetical protein